MFKNSMPAVSAGLQWARAVHSQPATPPSEHKPSPPLAVLSATGGLATGGTIAMLTSKNPPSQVDLFTRGNADQLNRDGLRVETSTQGPGAPRETLVLSPRQFRNLQWHNNEEARHIRAGTLVLEGGSALHLDAQMRRIEGKGLDVVTVANGLNNGESVDASGNQGHPGIAWFNGKDHPDGKPGKFISEGGSFHVTAGSQAFADSLAPMWNDGVVKLVLLPPGEGKKAEFRKAAANACLNPLNIVFGMKMKAMLALPGVVDLMRAICAEAAAVARASDADVGSGEDLLQGALALARTATALNDFHTSSYAPFSKGEETELRRINGEFAKTASALNVAAPLNALLNDTIAEMTADRRARKDDGTPRYVSDGAFRADPVQQKKQSAAIHALFRLAGVDPSAAPGSSLRSSPQS